MKLQLFLAILSLGGSQSAKTYKPTTPTEFQSVLDSSEPGDLIELLPIDYLGDFNLPAKPGSILVQGRTSPKAPYNSTRILGQNSALKIFGDSWFIRSLTLISPNVGLEVRGSSNRLESLSIQNTPTGILLEGNGNTLHSLSIETTRTGIVLTGDGNTLESISLRNGVQGILINGSNNFIQSTSISRFSQFSLKVLAGQANSAKSLNIIASTNTPSLILEGGSQGGRMDNINLSGLVQVNGSGYRWANLMSKDGLNVNGCGNIFSNAMIKRLWVRPGCGNDLSRMNMISSVENYPIS